jgi:hypothetical protein
MVPFVPLDAITSSSIQTAPDGCKVFFPWGAMGRGYAIASEHDYRRLQKQLTVQWVLGCLFGLSAVAFFANGYAPSFVAFFIVFVLWLLFYLAWLRYWRPRLQPSAGKFEIMPPQAGLRFASYSQIFGLAFLGTGLVLFIFDPSSRPIPTLAVGILSFGLGTVYYLLVLRRRR